MPFSVSTLGVRIGALAYNLAEVIAAITCREALPTLKFSKTSIAAHGGADGSLQAVGKSGVRAFEKLPTWNGTDLNLLCPGSSIPIQIRDDIPLMATGSEENTKLSLGLGLGLGLTSLVLLGVAAIFYNKNMLMEKELKRLKTEYAPAKTVDVPVPVAGPAAAKAADEEPDAEFADMLKV